MAIKYIIQLVLGFLVSWVISNKLTDRNGNSFSYLSVCIFFLAVIAVEFGVELFLKKTNLLGSLQDTIPAIIVAAIGLIVWYRVGPKKRLV